LRAFEQDAEQKPEPDRDEHAERHKQQREEEDCRGIKCVRVHDRGEQHHENNCERAEQWAFTESTSACFRQPGIAQMSVCFTA